MGCTQSSIEKFRITPEQEALDPIPSDDQQEFGTQLEVAVLKKGVIEDWIPAIGLCDSEDGVRVKIMNSTIAMKYGLRGREMDVKWKYIKKPEPVKPKIINPFLLSPLEIDKRIDKLIGREAPHLRRLLKEIQHERKEYEEMSTEERKKLPVIFVPSEDNLTQWWAGIRGPENSFYEGGTYIIELTFPEGYPFENPLVRFVTPVFHPNISQLGKVCLNLLNGEWTPLYNITKLLLTIQDLLAQPNPDDPLNNQAAALLKNDEEKFRSQAHDWVLRFAQR